MVELRNINKTYPGRNKKANNNISLDLKRGEILCIAGENGAGKTTLMKILCGLEDPDSGEIFLNGKKVIIDSPLAAKKLGIGMVHQHFMLFPEYTAAENIVMGDEPRKWGLFFDAKKTMSAAAKVVNENKFHLDLSCKVKNLSMGEMQQITICRCLYRNAQIIVLDEPTSVLTEKETESLFETLKNLAANGKSIILITHKMNEIRQICGRVAVLRSGELAGIRTAQEIAGLPAEGNMYNLSGSGDGLVRELRASGPLDSPASFRDNPQAKDREPVIIFDNITVLKKGQNRPLLDSVSFKLYPGEILGFCGFGGNGAGTLESVLAGFIKPSSGKILHKGNDITGFNTQRLRKSGLSYVPADRLNTGSAIDATIEENMIINKRHGSLRDSRFTGKFTRALVENYKIEGVNFKAKASTLSGGNLQKLILAREIENLADYIVFSEPSWGLDAASSSFIMQKIKKIRDMGAAVVLISTNIDEIFSLADRVVVMFKGKTAGFFCNTGENSVKEKITACMQGF